MEKTRVSRTDGKSRLFIKAALCFILIFGLGMAMAQNLMATNVTLAWSLGTQGSTNGQFINPYRISVDSSGNIYVPDFGNHRIQKFNSSGTYLSQFGTNGTGNKQFAGPFDVRFDSSGNIYVSDYWNNRVQKFNSSGTYLLQFGTTGAGNGQFSGPYEMAIDSSNNIYVTDYWNNRVQKFNSSGTYLLQFGTTGTGNGQFTGPGMITIDGSGNIYVVDTGAGDGRIQKFSSSGTYLSQFGTSGSGNGQFGQIGAITADKAGNIYVADNGNSRIQKFNSSGIYLSQIGKPDPVHGGLAIDSSGNIYVSDTDYHRIQKFSGTFPITYYTISGQITDAYWAAVSAVTLTFSNSGGTTTTDTSGNYTKTVTSGWSGTVTPSKTGGWTFDPVSKSYSNVTSNQTLQNYDAWLDYTISGYVKTSGGAAISGVTMTTSDGYTATTDSSGYYSFPSNSPWTVTITPSKTGYTFSPANKSYTNVKTTQSNQNFVGTPPTASYTISGTVYDSLGYSLSGVTLTFSNSGGTTTTDTSGNYSKTVTSGWSGTVTPSKSGGWTFTPASKSYTSVTSNQTYQDYNGAIPSYTISGYVKNSSGVAISGVSMTTDSGGSTTTDSSGYYSFVNNFPWSGTITPSKTGYTFLPASKSYTSVTTNQTNQNFTGTPPVTTYIISGNVYDSSTYYGISGVTLTTSSGGTTTTDSSGNYSFTANSGWSGTITPSKSGYTFSPASRSYTSVSTTQSSQNYTGTPPTTTYTISGYVYDSSYNYISGVTLTTSSGSTTTTDSSGNYSFTVSSGWSGTITPSKSGYTFSPSSKSYSSVSYNYSYETYSASYSGGTSFVTRTLPASYMPGTKLTVTLTATPPYGTASYIVEDTLPNGWEASNYGSMNGSYDKVNNKVKFFSTDGSAGTMTYDVTPPSTATGDKVFTGIGKIGNNPETAIGGQSTISKQQNQYHPADLKDDYNRSIPDSKISSGEFSEYLDAWAKGLSWTVSPSPIPMTYMLRAASLWQKGEGYKYNSSYNPPGCWETLYTSARNSERSSSTAVRQLPASYQKGQTITVSITVTPNSAVISYGLEDTPPVGWTNISNFSEKGKFENGKVIFGPFLSASGNMAPKTLTYTITVPTDASGVKQFTGNANFDSAVGDPEVITINSSVSDSGTQAVKGDVNGSGGEPDLADAILALQVLAGLNPPNVNTGGDVNGDGRIGLPEVIYILQKVAGLRPSGT